ncbi:MULTISPECIES: hypothetical protein [unclassified Nocardioides]|uniref:hypothetical protein n=1 Tax=unclassified Nocardioides TaxID=2615069 RepID=UPI0000EB6311|nr:MULTISPECIES: hypothetical protein [unclassified Nocardioides]ABL83762.1 hypothetical protein Noca_4265 [Nocardioides sp. JS614]
MGRRRAIVTVAVVAALAVLAGAAVVGVRWWRDGQRSELERAASYAPGDAQRLSWTDWAAVRADVGARLDESSSGEQVRDFLDRGYERDLTSTSALVQSAPVLQARFGFSPGTADWELFAQSEAGAVVILRMPDDTDFADLADRLEGAGFTRPAAGAEDGQVWLGGDQLLPTLGADLTPELQFVALDAGRHLVLTSDTADYLEQAVAGLGEGDLPEGVDDVLAASGDPLSAAVYDGPYACGALAMGQADASDQAQADQLLREAGDVDPLTGFAMSVQPDGRVRVAMGFETDDQARRNADSRSALADGPAPGQGGDFADRFSLDSATARGRVVRLDLTPRRGAYVLSDLSTGPVLFATC